MRLHSLGGTTIAQLAIARNWTRWRQWSVLNKRLYRQPTRLVIWLQIWSAFVPTLNEIRISVLRVLQAPVEAQMTEIWPWTHLASVAIEFRSSVSHSVVSIWRDRAGIYRPTVGRLRMGRHWVCCKELNYGGLNTDCRFHCDFIISYNAVDNQTALGSVVAPERASALLWLWWKSSLVSAPDCCQEIVLRYKLHTI